MELGPKGDRPGLLIIRHLRDVNDLSDSRDSSIESYQDDDALRVASELCADFENSDANSIFITASSKKRALESANLVKAKIEVIKPDVDVFIDTDDNLVDLDHGDYILPDNYKPGDYFQPFERAWEIFIDETFNKNNFDYKFGDSIENSDGSCLYPELKTVFTRHGESHKDICVRLYSVIMAFYANRENFEDARVRPYLLTHSLPFAIFRALIEVSDNVRSEGFRFNQGELMGLCWEIYSSGSLGRSYYGQISDGLADLIKNDAFIEMLRNELAYLKGESNG